MRKLLLVPSSLREWFYVNMGALSHIDSSMCTDSSTIALQLDKCLICQKDTAETLCVLGRGIDKFLQNCEITGHTRLVECLTADESRQYVVHNACRLGLSYEAKKTTKTATHESRHCCPPLSIFCCRLKSHLFSLSDSSLICTVPVAHTVTRHFGLFNRYYI